MKDYFLKASNALAQLNNSISINARSIVDITVKIYTQFEEIRYQSENIPDFIIHSDQTRSNLKSSGEIKVAQLLASILCERITDQAKRVIESLDLGEEGIDIKGEVIDIHDQVKKLNEVIQVQRKLANGSPVSTTGIKDLQKKYDIRIKQLEQELLRKEGRALTITALNAKKKPKIFGKEKFRNQLAELVIEYGKNLRASSGGYISLANLYNAMKNQVPDIEFSLKDLENACKYLEKQSLIEGIVKESGVKIVEFIPVTLNKDARQIFALALEKGYVTIEDIVLRTKWEQQRAIRVLKSLIEQKITQKVSSLDTGDRYYFPGLYGDNDW